MNSNLQERVFATFQRATAAGDKLDSLPKLSMPQDMYMWSGAYTDKYFALNQAYMSLCKTFFRPNYSINDVEIGMGQLDKAICAVDSHVECRSNHFRTKDLNDKTKSKEQSVMNVTDPK